LSFSTFLRSIVVEDEAKVSEYHAVLEQMEGMKTKLRRWTNDPEVILQFIAKGRLVRVRDGKTVWGWGAIVDYKVLIHPSHSPLYTEFSSVGDLDHTLVLAYDRTRPFRLVLEVLTFLSVMRHVCLGGGREPCACGQLAGRQQPGRGEGRRARGGCAAARHEGHRRHRATAARLQRAR
jgi:hypothetical protein